MKTTIESTTRQDVLFRRLAVILTATDYVGELGGNMRGFYSLGTGNNWAIKPLGAGKYCIWSRSDLPTNFSAVLEFII